MQNPHDFQLRADVVFVNSLTASADIYSQGPLLRLAFGLGGSAHGG